jgi:hypothetical protein
LYFPAPAQEKPIGVNPEYFLTVEPKLDTDSESLANVLLALKCILSLGWEGGSELLELGYIAL